MQSDRDKEQTRTVGVGMAEDVAGVDLAQNVFNGHSGTNHVRRVVHRKNDAGHDLNVQTDAAKATEFPKDVQVTRGWIVVKVAMTGRKSGLFQKSPRNTEAMTGVSLIPIRAGSQTANSSPIPRRKPSSRGAHPQNAHRKHGRGSPRLGRR